jgi:hypothetical protein
MFNFTNYPFKNMPITNGCFLTSFIPCVFTMFTGDYSLFVVWFACFSWSIVMDKYFYDI